MGFFSSIFGSAHDDTPLDQRDIVEIAPNDFFLTSDDVPERDEARAVSFDYIRRTGIIPLVSSAHIDIKVPEVGEPNTKAYNTDTYIDWESDDAFTRTIDSLEKSVFSRIEDSPELLALLDKDNWTRDDRVVWERGVSTIVSEELLKVPGLGDFRIAGNKEYQDTERRATRLNDLAVDIENDTKKIEFDCENMSIVEGLVLQAAEDRFLPESTTATGDYKVASNYFYISGSANFHENHNTIILHSYVMSSVTANIIEASNDPSIHNLSQYRENIDPLYSFEGFIKGKIAVHKDGSVYGGRNFQMDDVIAMRSQKQEEQGQQEEQRATEEARFQLEEQSPGSELQLLRVSEIVGDNYWAQNDPYYEDQHFIRDVVKAADACGIHSPDIENLRTVALDEGREYLIKVGGEHGALNAAQRYIAQYKNATEDGSELTVMEHKVMVEQMAESLAESVVKDTAGADDNTTYDGALREAISSVTQLAPPCLHKILQRPHFRQISTSSSSEIRRVLDADRHRGVSAEASS